MDPLVEVYDTTIKDLSQKPGCKQTNRQTDKQTNRQTDKQIVGQILQIMKIFLKMQKIICLLTCLCISTLSP